ncbi:hypothetical protein GGX14DRAFT_459404 [Mycena pura]|uniref:Zn(2)-C6 fungal-type domain-containing protein n=1 Tax=Mycena pura TaxID=153505 RepID=A0AAD6VB66_9AGAR|nr:hypothetical protein GGX14DRAFT_459404 [Mycena pura]
MVPGGKMRKKPPACDLCKAKRVLCHPQSNGLPCPRCAEKGLLCKTTHVPRGRPRKNPLSSEAASSTLSFPTAAEPLDSPNNVTSDTSSLLASPFADSASVQLSGDLVRHLFKCFLECPQYRHPLFRRNFDMERTLVAASWRLDLLPAQARVLACCICALSATFSWHPTIIGPGVLPESLADRSVFYLGADLRAYGVRRAPICRALYERAVSLACEARIHLEVSEHNAASCYILNSLEEGTGSSSRPWAAAYISHVRCLAASSQWTYDEPCRSIWRAFLMAEAFQATVHRKPIIISHADQLLITGSEPPSLESLLESFREKNRSSEKSDTASMVFTATSPCLFHATRLARELHENITGDYARRSPVSEVSVLKFLSALAIIQSLNSLLFSGVEFPAESTLAASPSPVYLVTDRNVRSCAFVISVFFTSLTLALHRELEYRGRATQDMDRDADATATHSSWAQERLVILRRQAHDMARSALHDVLRILQLQPYPLHRLHTTFFGVTEWAQFCADEADKAGGVLPAQAPVFEQILSTLKGLGYSQDDTWISALIERLEAHVTEYRYKAEAANIFSHGDTAQAAVSDMQLPLILDDYWTGILSSSNTLLGF